MSFFEDDCPECSKPSSQQTCHRKRLVCVPPSSRIAQHQQAVLNDGRQGCPAGPKPAARAIANHGYSAVVLNTKRLSCTRLRTFQCSQSPTRPKTAVLLVQSSSKNDNGPFRSPCCDHIRFSRHMPLRCSESGFYLSGWRPLTMPL